MEGAPQPPATALHRGAAAANYTQCHSTVGWRPAAFDHARLFLLDVDHNAPCATGHVNGDTTRHICYDCLVSQGPASRGGTGERASGTSSIARPAIAARMMRKVAGGANAAGGAAGGATGGSMIERPWPR